MTFIESLDCPHNTGEQWQDYNTPCFECAAPICIKEPEDAEEANSVTSSWDDIKYALCGLGAQLEYLDYTNAPSDISTSTSAEEANQYTEAM